MPTNFRIQLSAEMKATLGTQRAAIEADRASGKTVSYPDFVENLGKPMATAAEELHHHTTGMAGEAGELLDASKKVWIYQKPIDVDNILEELGDLRWYYQSALNMLGVTDADIVAINTAKLIKRYPSGQYSNEQAIARADKLPAAAAEALPQARKFLGSQAIAPLLSSPDLAPPAPPVTATSDAEFPHHTTKAEQQARRLAALNGLDGQQK